MTEPTQTTDRPGWRIWQNRWRADIRKWHAIAGYSATGLDEAGTYNGWGKTEQEAKADALRRAASDPKWPGVIEDDGQPTQSDGIAQCPKCGEPHPDKVIRFAKTFGASEALCRKCTAIEKRERFGITDEH